MVPNQDGLNVFISTEKLNSSNVHVGDSIAVQGACMTVTALSPQGFEFYISRTSLHHTVGLHKTGNLVNLEKPMQVGATIDGHWVTGHIDGIAKVICFLQEESSYRLIICVPQNLACYLAYKGSLAVNGISLTINSVEDHSDGCNVSMNIIPYTFANTTLGNLKAGDYVNLETDILARYLKRITEHDHHR